VRGTGTMITDTTCRSVIRLTFRRAMPGEASILVFRFVSAFLRIILMPHRAAILPVGMSEGWRNKITRTEELPLGWR
jgi:hypothetical protein